VDVAAGLAHQGMKLVVAIYSTFLQRAYDQILHDVCIESLPVTFAIDRGGIVGEDGPTHHGLFDLSFLRTLPNMIVMAPKDENELRRMLLTAINHPGPAAFRYPRGAGLNIPIDEQIKPIPIGKGEVLTEGDDLLILAIGTSVNDALKAHQVLSQKKIYATVVNCRFVKPLDAELICNLAKKIPQIITVEENLRQGGFGSAVLEILHDEGINNLQVKRLGIHDTFVEHGPSSLLRKKYGIDAQAIVNTAESMKLNTSEV